MKIQYLGLIVLLISSVSAQTGGTYDLSIANTEGGPRSSNTRFTLDSTIGQSAAGALSGNAAVSVRSGFWAFRQAAPTAADVSVSGRVTTQRGAGVRGVMIILTKADGTVRYASSNAFGFFRFDLVEAGRTYLITAVSGRHSFANSSHFIDVVDEVTGLVFVAN